MSLILRLVIGRVKVVYATLQTCFHDREILIGKSHVDHQIGVVAAEQFDELFNAVGIHAVGSDAASANLACDGLAFAARTGSEHDFSENIGILSTFVGHHGTNTAGSNDDNF